jgi:hypothetical protein
MLPAVSADFCFGVQIRCDLPSPLKWNADRTWTFAVSLRHPVLYLLRDHINMFIDLGKDWTSDPPADHTRFIPVLHLFRLEMHYFELNLYANDHNIIDKPLVKDENGKVPDFSSVMYFYLGVLAFSFTNLPRTSFLPRNKGSRKSIPTGSYPCSFCHRSIRPLILPVFAKMENKRIIRARWRKSFGESKILSSERLLSISYRGL